LQSLEQVVGIPAVTWRRRRQPPRPPPRITQ
jgi:uncharacterized protein (DUF2384 family)